MRSSEEEGIARAGRWGKEEDGASETSMARGRRDEGGGQGRRTGEAKESEKYWDCGRVGRAGVGRGGLGWAGGQGEQTKRRRSGSRSNPNPNSNPKK